MAKNEKNSDAEFDFTQTACLPGILKLVKHRGQALARRSVCRLLAKLPKDAWLDDTLAIINGCRFFSTITLEELAHLNEGKPLDVESNQERKLAFRTIEINKKPLNVRFYLDAEGQLRVQILARKVRTYLVQQDADSFQLPSAPPQLAEGILTLNLSAVLEELG